MAPADLLHDAVRRMAIAGHEGKSGAGLEKVWLSDGRALVVKRIDPRTDLTLRMVGGNVSRELMLWRSGVLDRLPPGVGHAILDAWVEEDGVSVVVMRDLGPAVLTWEDRLSVAATNRVVDRIAAVHREFLGHPPSEVARLDRVLDLFAPARIDVPADEGNELCIAARRGWEIFAETAPFDVAGPVMVLLENPTKLSAALSDGPVTLCHGDLATVNMALERDQLVLLDWALPVAGPGALDIARFLAGCSSVIEPGREEVIRAYEQAAGPAYDRRSMRLALLAGLVWLGWNKALDAAEHPDPAIRERERKDLDWWVHEARTTLDTEDI